MKFIPNSKLKKSMLNEIEHTEIDALFSDVSEKIKIKKLDLPKGLSQQETEQKLRKIADKNISSVDMPCFLGGGIKPHYIPAAVKNIISRSEFYTSYTPYQSEASQGFLQAMFEYQSMIAEITGMDIANASLYDGATALGEAALMCSRINHRTTFVIPKNISWEKKSVLKNYANGPDIKIKEVSYDDKSGKIDLKELKKFITRDTAGVYIENPNFFGVFEEDVDEINNLVKNSGSLLVVGVDPISLGVVRNPGEYGADIVIGEGRAFGNPMAFGGGSLGIFSCREEFLRQIPGRLIGLTKDSDGNRAFCMTFQTREQHIRRGKATSNICTNEGLCALAAVSYLAWLGGVGFEELSRVNFERSQHLADQIVSVKGFTKRFNGVHFNEFVIQCRANADTVHKYLLKKGIHGGLILSSWYPELKNCMLFGVTELHRDEDIEQLVSVLEEVSDV
jgi:glycine dehydrogenase subunit 1